MLGHDFARPALLAEALTHPSALPATQKGRRERPRRRGGAPRLRAARISRRSGAGAGRCGFAVAPVRRRTEGPLTRRHAQLVRRETLAAVAVEIGLDRMIQLSPAEAASGAARSPAILADVLEAVIAAIYLDGGFDAAFAFVERWWGPRLADMERPPRDPENAAAGMGAGPRSCPFPNTGSWGRAARTTRCSSRSRCTWPGMKRRAPRRRRSAPPKPRRPRRCWSG